MNAKKPVNLIDSWSLALKFGENRLAGFLCVMRPNGALGIAPLS
jgi:hypothetical protein